MFCMHQVYFLSQQLVEKHGLLRLDSTSFKHLEIKFWNQSSLCDCSKSAILDGDVDI